MPEQHAPEMRGRLDMVQAMTEPQKRGWYRLEDLDGEDLARLDTALADLRTIYGPVLERRRDPLGRACNRVLRLLAPAPPQRRVVDKALLSGNLPYMEWVLDTGMTRVLGSRFLFMRATVLELPSPEWPSPAPGRRLLLFGDGVTPSLLAEARRDGARFYGCGLSVLEERSGCLRPYRKWLGLEPAAAAGLGPDQAVRAGGKVYVPPGPPPTPASDAERAVDHVVWMPDPGDAADRARLEPLTSATTVLELFAAVTDRARLGERALDAVIALCTRSDCRRLHAGAVDDTWRALLSLAAGEPSEPGEAL